MLLKQNPKNSKFKCLQEIGSILNEAEWVGEKGSGGNRQIRDDSQPRGWAKTHSAWFTAKQEGGPSLATSSSFSKETGNPSFYVKSHNF